MTEKVDVVVVGAGLAGLFCAYELAGAGLEVLVLERGDYPGAKNVSGGRLYLNPVRAFAPDLWEEAPLERPVVKESITVMAPRGSTTVGFTGDALRQKPLHSATVLRSTFDRWLADKVTERGATIIPKIIVREPVMEKGRVLGIRADEEIHADVVVAADGVLSFVSQAAGLRKRPAPEHHALGVKEIIELPPERIEDRFGVAAGEGAAQLFVGSLSRGMVGGGFAYANRNSISLGLVVGIHALSEREPPITSHELYEEFKARPEVAALVAGGATVEYSAHAIPEGGIAAMPQLTGDGILLTGDAAGLGVNLGVTVRGMDFAIASGVMAARAILKAREARAQGNGSRADGPYTRAELAHYETLLQSSFVAQDMQTFAHMPHLLENPRFYTIYPERLAAMLEKIFWIGDGPKGKMSAEALGEARRLSLLNALRDGLDMLKV